MDKRPKILWLVTGSMSLEPIILSLEDFIPDALIDVVRFDTRKPSEVGDVMFHAIGRFQPDVILYAGPAEGPYLPSPQLMASIREIKPMVSVLCDGVDPATHRGVEAFQKANAFDLYVNIDGMTDWPHRPQDLTTLCPLASRFYPEPGLSSQRKHMIGFYGGAGTGLRKKTVEWLQARPEIDFVLGTRNEEYGSYQAYADFLRQCQYVFNISHCGSETREHVKARVLEVGLAGAVLLEHCNSPIGKYFTAGVDYLEWASPGQIDRIARGTPFKQADAIAHSLRKKVLHLHSGKVFWEQVFERLTDVRAL